MFEFLIAHPWLLVVGILFSRIADQTLATLRTISIFRGFGVLAAMCGFLEVLIWINVAGQVIRHLDSWYLTIIYAGGFAVGNAVGIWVESQIAFGHQMVRVLSRRENHIADKLWEKNLAVVEIAGKNRAGEIDVVFVAEKRKHVPALLRTIHEIDPTAYFTIEDVKQVGLKQIDPGVALGQMLMGEMGRVVGMKPEQRKS